MGERTVRLCDSTDSAGKLCEGTFEAVCPLCDRDMCKHHMGGCKLDTTIYAYDGNQQRILGFNATSVCRQCVQGLGTTQHLSVAALARTITPELLQIARALLAEKKLTESKG